MDNQTEIEKELALNENHDTDFKLLIEVGIGILNSLDGKTTSHENPNIYYAEGLAQKILAHIVSANHLYQGYQLIINNNIYQPQIDNASIAILTRAAMESYLTFQYVFVHSKSKDEFEFRFNCWHLGGFMDRANFVPQTEEHLTLYNFEKGQIVKLQEEIKATEIFNNLTSRNKALALQGRWRLSNSWKELGIYAGYSEKFFTQQYSFLSSYAHSSRLSVIQVQQNREFSTQKDMARASTVVLMTILSKFLHDYINLIPELNNIIEDKEKYAMIWFWKTIGDNLNAS